MRVGVFGVNIGVLADPDTMVRVAHTAEEAGWESIWTGEHLVVSDPHRPPSPVTPGTHFVDQVASLSFLAAHTSTIRLGTGIVILPQRNPIVLAKELAAVDVLSGGRLEAGFGVGYVPAEFEAIGVSFSERGARTDEYLDAMRALWRGDPTFAGRFTSWDGVEASPRPATPSGPPVHVGGSVPAAKAIAGIRAVEVDLDRPVDLGPVGLSVSPSESVDRDLVHRYEDLGVDRMILVHDFRDISRSPHPERAEAALRFLGEAPERLGFD